MGGKHALSVSQYQRKRHQMHIAEAGSCPLVVMCHGFPQSWYAYQLIALAEAGFPLLFPAVAPECRFLRARPEFS
jgi:pimeloyl-ACP methyl ester carboxylesterase